MNCRRSGLLTGLVVWLLAAAPLGAQVVRLPAVMPPSEAYPGELVSHPDSSINLLEPLLEQAESVNPDRPPDARDGVFQKLIFTSTWLDSGSSHGFGVTSLDLKTVLGFPIPSRRSPLVITPGFAVNYLESPAGVDLPPRVYDASMQFRWWKRFTPQFGIDFSVTPGVFSDFEQGTDEAVRISGHVAAMYEYSEITKIIFGVSYLDREDVGVLPVAGLIWTPTDDLKFELVAPRPRIAKRIYWDGAYTDDVQDWLYVAGEFGGGTWAVRRNDGSNDVVTYQDFRLIVGLQRWTLVGIDARLEIGYVFGREIQYGSATPDVEPSDTVMLRGGLTF